MTWFVCEFSGAHVSGMARYTGTGRDRVGHRALRHRAEAFAGVPPSPLWERARDTLTPVGASEGCFRRGPATHAQPGENDTQERHNLSVQSGLPCLGIGRAKAVQLCAAGHLPWSLGRRQAAKGLNVSTTSTRPPRTMAIPGPPRQLVPHVGLHPQLPSWRVRLRAIVLRRAMEITQPRETAHKSRS